MAQITAALLADLRTTVSAAFNRGLGQAESDWARIAFQVPSASKSNTYGWLGKFPSMREWIGERVINMMAEHAYEIVNRDFEQTIGVDRNDIKDDNLGIYGPMFQEMGEAVAALPDQLVFGALAGGFERACYDGQFFFDTDHPRLDAAGRTVSWSNMQAGAGTPWFLLDVSRSIKPIIYQLREPFTLVSKDKPDDDNVFMLKQYIYGTDGRCNVGYGFPQMAFGSKAELTPANYAVARASIRGLKGDYDRPLGLGRKLLLVVPETLEGKARALLMAERDADGATNIWKDSADMLVTSWLG
jgi:phage major head subunit gpT-like protein